MAKFAMIDLLGLQKLAKNCSPSWNAGSASVTGEGNCLAGAHSTCFLVCMIADEVDVNTVESTDLSQAALMSR